MGESINYHCVTSGNEQNRPLLFLHGFMGSTADWSDVMAALSDRYYCIAVDLPGHGKTEVECEDDYRMENCSQVILDTLDRMRIRQTGLVGYSMGGRLAYYLATQCPNRFDAVVIESATPGLETPLERRVRIEQDRQLADKLVRMPIDEFVGQWYGQSLFASIDPSSEAYNRMIKRRLVNDPQKLSRSLRMMGTGAQPPVWADLNRIIAPTLLIVGKLDVKFKRIASTVLRRCNRATAVVVENAGHNVHFENPEEFIRQVSLFLQTIGKD